MPASSFSARAAGLFLLLAALATAVSVPARLLADADQPTLTESLLAIIANRGYYFTGGLARLVSGLALLAAAWFLWRAMAGYHRPAVGSAAILLGVSGLVTAVSGACAVAIAAAVPAPAGPTAILMASDGLPNLQPLADARAITGKAGFTLAGLGLIALGPAQWRVGGLLKVFAVADMIIGVAMLFIWVDAATVMHRVSGVAFLAWLIVSGLWLVAGLLKPPPILTNDATQHETGEYEYGQPR